MTPDPGAKTSDIVQVWLIRTDLPAALLADLETLLDDDERQRSGALQLASHRHRFIAAHGAVRVIVGRSVGVDIQQLPAELDVARMAARFYPPQEARHVTATSEPSAQVDRFIRLWTRKEACVKVAGGRLFPALKLPVSGSGPIVVRDPDGPPPGLYLVRDVPAPRGFYASVAMAGALPYRVTRRWWPGGRPSA